MTLVSKTGGLRKGLLPLMFQISALAGAAAAGTAFAQVDEPNILFILADDVGYTDIGAYRSAVLDTAPVVPTPNLNRIAEEGIRFMDAHAPAAVCAPTRYSAISGNYPGRGITRWGTWRFNALPQFRSNQLSIAQMLPDNYNNAYIGKRHLGGDWYHRITGELYRGDDLSLVDFARAEENSPSALGFDYLFITPNGIQGQPYAFFENDYLSPMDGSGNTDLVFLEAGDYNNGNIPKAGWGDPDWDSSQVGRILVDKAVAFIDEHHTQNLSTPDDRPFFMVFNSQAIHLPHTPLDLFEPGVPVAGASGINAKTDMLIELDAQVGALVTALEERGLLADTLVIMTSDNGGIREEVEEVAAGHESNGALKGSKKHVYEGGHRVPLIARWGDGTTAGSRIRPGTVARQMVAIQDWVATALALTGEDIPQDQAMDSASLLGVLTGEADPNLPVRDFMILQGARPAEGDTQTAVYGIRLGNHVMVMSSEEVPLGLYDLHHDLAQKDNLLEQDEQATRLEHMLRVYDKYSKPIAPTSVYREPVTSVTPGSTESDDVIRVIGESTLTLDAPVTVDAAQVSGNTYDMASIPAASTLPVGTRVSSYLLHFDPENNDAAPLTLSHSFDRPIIGLGFLPQTLAAQDAALGATAITYPNDSSLNRGALSELFDRAIISADGKTIDLSLWITGGIAEFDQVRVLLGFPDQLGVYRIQDGSFFLDTDGDLTWENREEDWYAPGVAAGGQLPLSGDWDCDGFDEIGSYNPVTHQFVLDINGDGRWTAQQDRSTRFGGANSLPLAGDWDGDGCDEIAVFRPETGSFMLDSNGDGRWNTGDTRVVTGVRGQYQPVGGDWNCDGIDEIAVFDTETLSYRLDSDGDRVLDPAEVSLNSPGSLPVSGDWNADGCDELGSYDLESNTFHLDVDGSGTWNDSEVDRSSGRVGNGPRVLPLAGRWSRPGAAN